MGYEGGGLLIWVGYEGGGGKNLVGRGLKGSIWVSGWGMDRSFWVLCLKKKLGTRQVVQKLLLDLNSKLSHFNVDFVYNIC